MASVSFSLWMLRCAVISPLILLAVLVGIRCVADWWRSRPRRRYQVIDLAERRAMQEQAEIRELEK